MARMVNCVKLGRLLPGLEQLPFPGELGQRIYDQVSQAGYALWPEQEILLMNHYGLNMADPSARELLLTQMEQFFFGEQAQMPAGWTPPGQSGKGAPAPRRKK